MTEEEKLKKGLLFFPGDPELKAQKLRTHNLNLEYNKLPEDETEKRSEIINKYQFSPASSVNYKEISRELQALKVGGVTLAAGGAIEVGAVLISGLSLSSLVPIPIAALVAVSIGVVLTDYYAIEPARSKKALKGALDNYLTQTKGQFLNWFDEIERYFNKRVEEIKQTM